MNIQTKFNEGDSVYFFKSASEIQIIKIKSVEVKSAAKGYKTNYISEDNREFTETDLLNTRDLTNRINGYQ